MNDLHSSPLTRTELLIEISEDVFENSVTRYAITDATRSPKHYRGEIEHRNYRLVFLNAEKLRFIPENRQETGYQEDTHGRAMTAESQFIRNAVMI